MSEDEMLENLKSMAIKIENKLVHWIKLSNNIWTSYLKAEDTEAEVLENTPGEE